jgi:hypothetical protein
MPAFISQEATMANKKLIVSFVAAAPMPVAMAGAQDTPFLSEAQHRHQEGKVSGDAASGCANTIEFGRAPAQLIHF